MDRMATLVVEDAAEVTTMLESEALSCRDIARIWDVPETDARRLLRERVKAGKDGFTVEGGPLKIQGTWLATLGWWRSQLRAVD